MGETQASSIFQEWARKYAPGLVAQTTFPDVQETLAASPETSMPASPTPSPAAPVASPVAQDVPVVPTPDAGAPGPSLTDRFNSGLSRVGEGLKDPTKMGLLTAGLSMLATPPRQVPYSNAEILGNAGLAGVNMYEKALEAKRRDTALQQTAEEHALAREDRRTAATDRAEYYKDRIRVSTAEQESKAEARKATAAENAVLDVPIDSAVAKHYGVDPKMTVRTFNKMQAGLTAMAKPNKETKPDAFTEWYQARVAEGKKPTSKDIEGWHRGPGSGGGSDNGPGKVGQTGQVNRELVAMYLPGAKENLSAKGPAGMEEYKGMVAMFQTTDQFGGTVNDARLRESLSPEQRKEYDFVKRKGQDYGRTMTPANAVAKAQEEWKAKNPASKDKASTLNQRYNEMMAVDAEIRRHGYSPEETNRRLKELHAYGRQQGLIQ